MYLQNPVWAALTSVDAPFALGQGLARRFQPDVIPFAALAEPTAEALGDLVPLLMPGEEIYLTLGPGETIEPVAGIEVLLRFPGLQMRHPGAIAEEEEDAVIARLGRGDVPEMLDLKARAFPGYFGPRAPELGSFFGVRDARSGRLIAMAGERLATETDREVSAVCTDPAYLGQGHAARLVRAVLRHQAELGVGSVLHVTAANGRAISLYERLGFGETGPLEFVKLRRV